MRVHVAFPPSEAATAELGIVVDVVRAPSSIAQALASGYRRVLCCAEVEQARALRAWLGDEAVVGGERDAVRIEGFDLGASPRELLEPRAETLILSTTNGTRAILTAAERCDEVLLGSLLNLDAVARAAAAAGEVAILCAGFKGAFAFDDAYCAGRIVVASGGQRTDAALAAELLARAFPRALDGLNARTYGPPGLEADIEWCARESVLDVVPRLTGVVVVADAARLVDDHDSSGIGEARDQHAPVRQELRVGRVGDRRADRPHQPAVRVEPVDPAGRPDLRHEEAAAGKRRVAVRAREAAGRVVEAAAAEDAEDAPRVRQQHDPAVP